MIGGTLDSLRPQLFTINTHACTKIDNSLRAGSKMCRPVSCGKGPLLLLDATGLARWCVCDRGTSKAGSSSAICYSPVYVKALLRKGRALMGLGCTRDAVSALQEGLRLDPFHADMRKDLDAAHNALLEDVLTGTLQNSRRLQLSWPIEAKALV